MYRPNQEPAIPVRLLHQTCFLQHRGGVCVPKQVISQPIMHICLSLYSLLRRFTSTYMHVSQMLSLITYKSERIFDCFHGRKYSDALEGLAFTVRQIFRCVGRLVFHCSRLSLCLSLSRSLSVRLSLCAVYTLHRYISRVFRARLRFSCLAIHATPV